MSVKKFIRYKNRLLVCVKQFIKGTSTVNQYFRIKVHKKVGRSLNEVTFVHHYEGKIIQVHSAFLCFNYMYMYYIQ